MRAGLALAATTLVASPAFAANEEWPGWPEKRIFSRAGERVMRQTACARRFQLI